MNSELAQEMLLQSQKCQKVSFQNFLDGGNLPSNPLDTRIFGTRHLLSMWKKISCLVLRNAMKCCLILGTQLEILIDLTAYLTSGFLHTSVNSENFILLQYADNFMHGIVFFTLFCIVLRWYGVFKLLLCQNTTINAMLGMFEYWSPFEAACIASLIGLPEHIQATRSK